MTLAAARRDPAGTWSGTTYLDTGKDEPSAPRAAMGADSRIHVVWKIAPAKSDAFLRYRAYDLTTLQALGDEAGPFDAPPPKASPSRARPAAEESGKPAGRAAHKASPSEPSSSSKPAAFSLYGVESGCEAAVVYRVVGRRLEVATLAGGKWSRGNVELESSPEEGAARALVSDIARRFCTP